MDCALVLAIPVSAQTPHAPNLSDGRSVAPGVYWVRLTQGANQKTARVAVIE